MADLILPSQPLPWPLYRFFPLRSGREWRPAPIEVVLGFDALRCSDAVPVFDLTAISFRRHRHQAPAHQQENRQHRQQEEVQHQKARWGNQIR